jgi:pimeloyl-ACP methyl ester carboxylesterase
VTPLTPEKIFYHDLPLSEAAYWSSKLKRHSYSTKFAGASTAAWRTIPSTYLICEDDRANPVVVQEAMVKACQDAGADMKTERLFASHSPFLSKPDEFVAFLRRAAGEDV